MVETQLCKLRHTPDTLIGRSWSQRAARVAPRANAKVPPHPGRISSHLRFRNPSISLQLQQREAAQKSAGSIPSCRVWKPQSHWPIADWLGFLESARGELTPRANAAVPPQPKRTRSHRQVRNRSISLQLQQPGAVMEILTGQYRPAGC